MTDLSILVPVLARPHRVRPILESAAAAIPDAEVLFIADPDDEAELEALEAESADYIVTGGSYAYKINEGVRATTSPLVFSGADDLTFIPGWFEAATAHLTDQIRVVGVTDEVTKRNRQGRHAPHFLMTREYALQPTIDSGRGPLCELYGHQFVDDELLATARFRGALHIATDARVQHHHYFNGTGDMDATYEKGLATKDADHLLFKRRRQLWM